MRKVYWTEYIDGTQVTLSQVIFIGLFGTLVPLGAAHLQWSVFLKDLVDFIVSQDFFQRKMNSFDFSELDIRALAISICWSPVVICVTMGAHLVRWKGGEPERSKSGTAEVKAIKPIPSVALVLVISSLLYTLPLSNSRGIPLTLSFVATYPFSPFLICMLAFVWGSVLQGVVASALGSLSRQKIG